MKGANAFFDTNVILYLFSADVAKADTAEQVMASGGHVSVQVLNEVANVARRKLRFSWADINDVMLQLRSACKVEPLTVQTHEYGLCLAERLQISVYDGMIVASALLAKCTTLYSEDLQTGRVVEGTLAIRNPFVTR
jgi:predicted nucleic acid-binding protein